MSQAGQTPTELVIRGKRIAQDEHGFLSLTDMWRLAGAENSKRPAFWQRLPTTRELAAALISNVRFSHIWANTPDNSAIYTKRGNRGGTFAHVILGLAFAEYLDARLSIEVWEIASRFWSGDITLFDDLVRRRELQAMEDGGRIVARERIRDDNSKLQFGILHGLGARNPAQHAAFHNAGYRGMYNGEDENAIHQRKDLKPEQRILDHMGYAELAANMFRTTQIHERLRNVPADTLPDATAEHQRMGQRVRDFMKESGSRMPEDMPTADSIADARKRLRGYEKGQKKIR